MLKVQSVLLVAVAVLSPVHAFVGVQVPGLANRMQPFAIRPAHGRALALRSLKMQEQQTEEQVQQYEQPAIPPPPRSDGRVRRVAPKPSGWFERTTVQDRAQRVGGDPLAPKIGYKPRELTGVNAKMEEDGVNWYKSQQERRSLFGKTLNPLTGALEDKDKSVQALNPLEDPIFYIILIVGSPVLVMVAAAYSCVVPALSVAFGAQCDF